MTRLILTIIAISGMLYGNYTENKAILLTSAILGCVAISLIIYKSENNDDTKH